MLQNVAAFVLTGVTLSSGLGESPVSPDLRVQAESRSVRASAFFSPSDKISTGAGWILAGDLDVGLGGGVFGGAGLHHRSGGIWTKDSLWLRVGWQRSGWRALVRKDFTTFNRVGAGELTFFRTLGAVRVENTVALVRFLRQDGRICWGGYTQFAFGWNAAANRRRK